MFFKGFKIATTRNFFFLLLLGMLLINIVGTFIWQQHATGLLISYAEKNLSIIFSEKGTYCMEGINEFFNELFESQSKDFSRNFAILLKNGDYRSTSPAGEELKKTLNKSVLSRAATYEKFGKSLSLYGVQVESVIVAKPVKNCDNIAAVGIHIDAAQLSREIADKQSLIYVYILVNAIILTTIWFFRMRKLLFKPLDNLVAMTESFGIESSQLLQRSQKKNEFGQLSEALQNMFARIQKDKKALTKNVTSLEEANAQILENQKNLIEAEKFAAVGRLSAGLAHEIGNPLGIVQGYLELLGKEDVSHEDRQQYAERATTELQRMNQLIHQLLDFARKKNSSQSRTLVSPVINELIEMLQCQKSAENIVFTLNCESFAEKAYCNEADLHQVLLNCILNAIDAINEKNDVNGKIHITCILEITGDQKYAKITIKDNGVGVSSEVADSAFEPFFTTKDIGHGTGLGLSVSRSIIESSGGSIHMESEKNTGTLLVITVPVE